MTIPQTEDLDQKTQSDTLPTAHFQCQLCGECCSSWQIPIETEKAESLFPKKWVQKRLTDNQLAFESLDAAYYRVPLKQDGYCVFLGEDKRCLIEVNEGYEAKPEQCKRFPFARTELKTHGEPEETREIALLDTEASGFCKAIAEKYWPQGFRVIPGERDRSFVGETLPRFLSLRQPLFFRRQQKLETQLFFEKQTQALNVFETTPMSSLGDLEKALKKLAFAWIFEKSYTEEFTPFSNQTHQLMSTLFLRHPHGWVSAEKIWKQGVYLDYKLFGMPLDLKNHSSITPPRDPEALKPLRFFLSQFLRRKVPYTYGHTAESLICAAFVSYFVVIWYAKTNAMIQERNWQDKNGQEREQIFSEDIVLAIRTTERYYTGHQPEFLDQFRTAWWTPYLLKWLA